MWTGAAEAEAAPRALDFRPIGLKDRGWMSALLEAGRRGSLEYNFTSNFLWSRIYKLRVARLGSRFVIRAGRGSPGCIFPAGSGPAEPILKALEEWHRQEGLPLIFNTVLKEDREVLESLRPGGFDFELLPDNRDYVYEARDLITLAGRRYSGKRNHIRRFLDAHPQWRYEPLGPDNLEDAHAMSREWCERAGCRERLSLFDESCAVERAFRHYFDLGLRGGLLRSRGQVLAFTMGEPLNPDTYLIHIEKAFAEVQGAYPMINQLFAREEASGYRYINREDDAGDEGLRRAKLSYHPAFLVEKYRARARDLPA